MLTDDDDELLPFGSPLQHGVLTPVLPSTGSNKRRPPDEQPLHDESVHDRIKRLRIASFNSSDGGGPSDMPPGAAPSALPHPGLGAARQVGADLAPLAAVRLHAGQQGGVLFCRPALDLAVLRGRGMNGRLSGLPGSKLVTCNL